MTTSTDSSEHKPSLADRLPAVLRRILAPDVLPLLLLPLTLFVLVPAVVARNNGISILRIAGWVWGRLFLIALVAAALLVLARVLTPRGPLRTGYQLAVTFLFFVVLWAGFFFPVSRDTDVTDVQAAPVNTFNLSIVLALSLLMAYLATRYWMHVTVGLSVFLLANVAMAAWPEQTAPVDVLDRPEVGASSSFNVFVISFDGLSGTPMTDILASDATLRERLRGFTVFDNAASSSPATTASIAAELYGNRNYKQWHRTLEELRRHDPDRLLTNVLLDHGFRTTTFGNYRIEFNGSELDSAQTIDQSGLILLQGAVARTLTGKAIPGGWTDEVLHSFLTRREVVPDSDAEPSRSDSELIEQVLASPTNPGTKDHTLTVLDYLGFVDGLTVTTDEPAAFFLHFTHTHFPVEFDSSCRYRAHDVEWFKASQNFEGALAEHRCAAAQLARLIDRIEALGILDNSIVVLKGDHGKPTRYAKPDSIEEAKIADHKRFGVSRYAPFLAIKPAHADLRQPMEWDRQPVMLDDLARTLCEESLIEYDCTVYPGYNILRDSIDPSSQVTVYVVESALSSYRYDEHLALTVPRGNSVVQSIHDALAK